MAIEGLPMTEAEADEVARDASGRFLAAKESGQIAQNIYFSDFYAVDFNRRLHDIPAEKQMDVILVVQQILNRVNNHSDKL